MRKIMCLAVVAFAMIASGANAQSAWDYAYRIPYQPYWMRPPTDPPPAVLEEAARIQVSCAMAQAAYATPKPFGKPARIKCPTFKDILNVLWYQHSMYTMRAWVGYGWMHQDYFGADPYSRYMGPSVVYDVPPADYGPPAAEVHYCAGGRVSYGSGGCPSQQNESVEDICDYFHNHFVRHTDVYCDIDHH